MFDSFVYPLYYSCNYQPIYNYILGVVLCIGGIISYAPQYYAIIKTKQSKGISELSLLLLNIGSFCLTTNSFILNWWKFKCYNSSGNMLNKNVRCANLTCKYSLIVKALG